MSGACACATGLASDVVRAAGTGVGLVRGGADAEPVGRGGRSRSRSRSDRARDTTTSFNSGFRELSRAGLFLPDPPTGAAKLDCGSTPLASLARFRLVGAGAGMARALKAPCSYLRLMYFSISESRSSAPEEEVGGGWRDSEGL